MKKPHLILAICLAAFGASCGKKTPTLNLLVWEGYADPSFVKAFEEQTSAKSPRLTWDPATNWWPNSAAAAPETMT